jgi:homeobox protein cut-like
VKAAEADDLEAEVRRLREENADLKRRANETATVDAAKAKLEGRLEQMEAKVRYLLYFVSMFHTHAMTRWRSRSMRG